MAIKQFLVPRHEGCGQRYSVISRSIVLININGFVFYKDTHTDVDTFGPLIFCLSLRSLPFFVGAITFCSTLDYVLCTENSN